MGIRYAQPRHGQFIDMGKTCGERRQRRIAYQRETPGFHHLPGQRAIAPGISECLSNLRPVQRSPTPGRAGLPLLKGGIESFPIQPTEFQFAEDLRITSAALLGEERLGLPRLRIEMRHP
ncbi:hypothetical protein D3C87_999010 [compost metagenome]